MDERLLPYSEDAPLMHAGVKGMKWGKRKARNQAIIQARYKNEMYRNANNEIVTRLNNEAAKNPNSAATKKAVKDYEKLAKNMERDMNELRLAKSFTTGEKAATTILAVGSVAAIAVGTLSKLR